MHFKTWIQSRPAGTASIVILMFIAVLFRVIALSNLPGINGDEAWYGLIALEMLDGNFSTLTTQHGNILNPFYILPLVVVHVFFEPSFTLLRTISLLSGLLLISLSYFLSAKIFDKKIALIIMLVVTCLPVNIAYSRFGWDTSQSVLFSMVVIYALLTSRWFLLVLSLVAAILIHPTNVALVLMTTLYIVLNRVFVSSKLFNRKYILIFSGVIFLICLFFLLNQELLALWLPMADDVISQDRGVAAVGMFILNISRFFTGTTVFWFISGAGDSGIVMIIDLICSILILLMFVSLLAYTYYKKNVMMFSFVLSFCITLIIWFLLFSNFPLQPGTDRYSLFLVMPMATCIGFFCQRMNSLISYKKILFGSLIFCFLLLSNFAYQYFYVLQKTGGMSHVAFKTNYVEPKKMVYQIVNEQLDGGDAVLISSQWWNSKPLSYLAYQNEKLDVIELVASEVINISDRRRLFINTFVDDELDNYVNEQLFHEVENVWAFNSFSGEPVMMLYEMNPIELDLYID